MRLSEHVLLTNGVCVSAPPPLHPSTAACEIDWGGIWHTAASEATILLLEHKSVYTLGRGSKLEHVTFARRPPDTSPSADGGGGAPKQPPHRLDAGEGVQVVADERGAPHQLARVERGGEVTWHGPGQLVAYPIVDLSRLPPLPTQDDAAAAAAADGRGGGLPPRDLHAYVRAIEEVVIRSLAKLGVPDAVRTAAARNGGGAHVGGRGSGALRRI